MSVARLKDARRQRDFRLNPKEEPQELGDVNGRLRALECDPIAALVKIAQDMTIPAALRAKIFAELATYVAPRRKAEAVSGDCKNSDSDGQPAFDLSKLSDAELETMIELYRKIQ
jgi:hypothetical protein